jgi:hypothetical protein
MLKLRVPIEEKEFSVLVKLAQLEMRNPGEQAHFIIRQELERRGLLRQCMLISSTAKLPFEYESNESMQNQEKMDV